MKDAGGERPITYMERARRSAAIDTGRRDKVPLTVGSEDAPGATYAIHVSRKYDPLTPTALVIGLHGGGDGGKDDALVSGSGESGAQLLREPRGGVGLDRGLPVRAQGAVEQPRERAGDRPHDRGGATACSTSTRAASTSWATRWAASAPGTGVRRARDLFAACAPCAGGGGTRNASVFQSGDLPVYIYHGADDRIVRVDNDRAAAKLILGDGKKKRAKVDAVYTELDGVGHGFPSQVRHDIFRWFAGRWKDSRKLKESSFDEKVTRAEIEGVRRSLGAADRHVRRAVGEGARRAAQARRGRRDRGGGGARPAPRQGDREARRGCAPLAQVDPGRPASPRSARSARSGCRSASTTSPRQRRTRTTAWSTRWWPRSRVSAARRPTRCSPTRPAELGRKFRDSFSGGRHHPHRVRGPADQLDPGRGRRSARPATPTCSCRFSSGRSSTRSTCRPRCTASTATTTIASATSPSRPGGASCGPLADALISLGDPRGRELCERVAEAWSHESQTAGEAERGVDALAP